MAKAALAPQPPRRPAGHCCKTLARTRRAALWAREGRPCRLDAEAGLRRRSGARPKSPTALPLATEPLSVQAEDQKLLALWYDEGALLRSEDCVCAAATVLSALQAFDFSALQPSSGLLDMDNPFATRAE